MKIEGKNAVRETLNEGITIDKLYVQNGTDNGELVSLAKQKGLKFTTTKLYQMEKIVIFHYTLYYTTNCIKSQCKNICSKQMFFL